MVRILVLGGTRFTGKLVATELAQRHDVLVLSRNNVEIPGAARLIAQRGEGLAKLAGTRFDLVLDFIAFDGADLAQVSGLGGGYVAISTSWLPSLTDAASPVALVPPDASCAPATMMEITKKYLVAKSTLEHGMAKLRAGGYPATAVRLPIMFGAGDHSGRSLFYGSRIVDGAPILMIDGGANLAQVLWSEDAARALVALIESGEATRHPIWEGLPHNGCRVRDFVGTVAKSLGRTPDLVDAPFTVVQAALPAYLEAEPLWRERSLPPSEANLFRAFGIAPHPLEHWIAAMSDTAVPESPTRSAERDLARRLACS